MSLRLPEDSLETFLETSSAPFAGLDIHVDGPFDIEATLECGQTFGWSKLGSDSGIPWYKGVIGSLGLLICFDRTSSTLRVLYDPRDLKDSDLTMEPSCSLPQIISGYFSLDDDVESICEFLATDPAIRAAVSYGYGLRILRQDPWECLVSYITSTMNNIPAICKITRYFRETLGEPVGFGEYTFPTPEKFLEAGHHCVRDSRCGFRSGYIMDAAEKLVRGEVDLDLLHGISSAEARDELQKIKGVGPKVADCVLLFGYHRLDVFPVDRWVARAMSRLYSGGDQMTEKKAREEGSRRFGPFAGYAQEYLFHYIRNQSDGR
jgi:N-glycosylase/DNA lyase